MTNKMKYIGKTLLIETSGKKILVIGDLHLGYEESLNRSGILVTRKMLEEIISDLDKIFRIVGKVDKIVLLGDVKHEFSGIMKQEWEDTLELFDYLHKWTKEIIVTKGNHDNYLKNIAGKRDFVSVEDYYIFGEYCFMHGNKDFDEARDKKIKYWIMGHAHPAVKLTDGTKMEKYKCFLEGEYKKKKIIILPSFAEHNAGSDPRENENKLAGKFNLGNFKVKIVGEDLKVLDFGKLKDVK